jgi:salicylate biosynthesis isochorismate synthase
VPTVGLLDAALVHRFRALAREAARRAGGGPVLAWASGPVEQVPWLLPREPGWLWRSPRTQAAAAGEAWAARGVPDGTAAAWRSLLQRSVAAGPVGPVAFCGVAFDPAAAPAGPWAGFPPSVVSVPRVLWLRVRDRRYVALACLAAADTLAEEVERTLTVAERWSADEPRLASGRARVVAERPAPDAWKSSVTRAEACCRAGPLRKVVLARSVELAGFWRPAEVVRRLQARYPTCTTFATSQGGATFLGATPERLAFVRAGRMLTEALAGTAARGGTREEDSLLRRQLEESPKQRWEHELVADHVRAAVQRLCARVWEGRREVVALPNVQHLRTRFAGRLRPLADAIEAALALHPTPAVAGSPIHLARAWLRQHEWFDRGWYAGVVGWVGAQAAELVVAIRSALLRADRAWAFAGCGIVAGSDPEAEYRESEAKLLPLLQALGAEVP